MELPDDARITRVEFARNPDLLPFGNIIDSVWYLSRILGYQARRFFCEYKGIRFEDAASVMGVAMHEVDDPRELTLLVRHWRDQADACFCREPVEPSSTVASNFPSANREPIASDF